MELETIRQRKFTISKLKTHRQELIDEIYSFYGKDTSIIPSLQKLINEKGIKFVEETFREVSKINRTWKYLCAVLSRTKIIWK